jgi:hypothetical protein
MTIVVHFSSIVCVMIQLIIFRTALNRHNIPFELHVFSQGYHGMGVSDDPRVSGWKELCETWLKSLGFITN